MYINGVPGLMPENRNDPEQFRVIVACLSSGHKILGCFEQQVKHFACLSFQVLTTLAAYYVMVQDMSRDDTLCAGLRNNSSTNSTYFFEQN